MYSKFHSVNCLNYTCLLQFVSHMKFHYQRLSQLIALSLKEEVRIVLRSVFIRIGHEISGLSLEILKKD